MAGYFRHKQKELLWLLISSWRRRRGAMFSFVFCVMSTCEASLSRILDLPAVFTLFRPQKKSSVNVYHHSNREQGADQFGNRCKHNVSWHPAEVCWESGENEFHHLKSIMSWRAKAHEQTGLFFLWCWCLVHHILYLHILYVWIRCSGFVSHCLHFTPLGQYGELTFQKIKD